MNLRKDHYHTDPTDRTLRTVARGPFRLARGAAKEEELEAALRGVSTEKAALEAERADLQKAQADARDEARRVERARKRADGERAELVRKAAQRTEYLQQQLDAHRSGKAAAEGALAREKTQTDSTTRELDALRAVFEALDFVCVGRATKHELSSGGCP